MFQEIHIKLKCWFQNFTVRQIDRRYTDIDMDITQALKNTERCLFIDDVKTEKVTEQAVANVTRYTSKSRSIYVKHVFMNGINAQVKPKISDADIDFFRALNHASIDCYVLVYVKNQITQQYDRAFFLDDYEAIQGIGKAEAQCRVANLSAISKIIRTVLL